MKILPTSQRKTFDYRGKIYTAFGKFDAGEQPLRRVSSRHAAENTPAGYDWLELHDFAGNLGITADVYLYDGRPVTPVEGEISDYRPVPHVPPPGLLNMQPTATEYESTAAGTEYLIRLQTDDTPPQEWCRYEFTEPGGRRFLVTAPPRWRTAGFSVTSGSMNLRSGCDKTGGPSCLRAGRPSLTVSPTCKKRPMKPFVRIAPDVKYSTDYDFFLRHQLLIFNAFDGTSFCSGLESRVFLRTASRNISSEMKEKICRQIHRDICTLRYGGELTD